MGGWRPDASYPAPGVLRCSMALMPCSGIFPRHGIILVGPQRKLDALAVSCVGVVIPYGEEPVGSSSASDLQAGANFALALGLVAALKLTE